MKNNLQNNSPIEEKKLDWKIVQNVMKDKFGSDIFDSWLKKIQLIDEYKNYGSFDILDINKEFQLVHSICESNTL